MKFSEWLIPPSLDAKQALRLRRFGIGMLGYALAVVMMAVAWAFDAVPASTALSAAAMFTAINLALYAAFRSGFNLRAADPSLTSVQIAAAVTILMYFVYHMAHGRSTALFSCFVIFLFAIYRLNAREITALTLYTLTAHALVIILLLRLRPQVVADVPGEWMSWIGLAVFLPAFILIGGQIEKLRRRLRESEARFRSLTEMSSDFYWESDAGHRLTQRSSADKKVSAVSVFRQGAQIGERRWDIPYLSPDEAGWRAHRADLDAHRPFRAFELSRLGEDGSERHISISGDPVFGHRGEFRGYRGVGTDITEHKQAEARIQHAAHHDALTGLPNRSLFDDRLGQAIVLAKRDARQFAVLFLDLDRFKPVNDSLGHAAGDELLQAVALRIRHQVRDSDTVARIGGDEFAVILPDIGGHPQAELVAAKIMAAVGEPFELGNGRQRVEIGTSIGIAIYPLDASDADGLVQAADAAMYEAKQVVPKIAESIA